MACMLRGAQFIPRARIAPHASRRTARAPWTRGRACAPASGRYSLSRVVSPKVLAASDGACLSARDRASENVCASSPIAPQPQLRGFLRSQAPVSVYPPHARPRKMRYVCVLIALGAVAPEALNTFPQVTAPRTTPLAARRALKRRRIAFPARLQPPARVSRQPAVPCARFPLAARPPAAHPRVSRPFRAAGACNAFASAAFRACFASIEALLTRTLSGHPRTFEPTMQTVQTDRSTLAR